MRRHLNWLNVVCLTLALFVFASTFNHAKWGQHYCFMVAYGLIGLYCTWRRLWIGVATCLTLVALRWYVAEGVTGWQLRVTSTAFVVFLALMCVDRKRLS